MTGPTIIQRTELLKPETVAVSDEGHLVAITIGTATIRMQYEDALKFSTWIRRHAKKAKARAGDVSRHWSVAGNLEAVDAGENPFARKWV